MQAASSSITAIIPPPPPPLTAGPGSSRWRIARTSAPTFVTPCSPPNAHTAEKRERLRTRLAAGLDRLRQDAIDYRLEDAPAWLVSMVIHLILLLILALISTTSGELGQVLLTITQGGEDATVELAEFSIVPIVLADVSEEEPMEAVVEIALTEFDPSIDLSNLLGQETSNTAPLPGAPPLAMSSPKLTSMFAGRTGAMKQQLLRHSGGTEATEDAVVLGLEWLRRQQLRDGSWSLSGPYANGGMSENKTAATAMAMLAFMGAGSTHRSGKYEKEVLRAVRWLVQQQDREGFMAHEARDHEKMYAQAQATIALCELYAMTGDSWIRPYAQAACDFAAAAQSPEGGWRYQPRYDSDTSVTGWFVMGLKSGDAAGLEVDPYIWAKVSQYLDTVSSRYEAGYSYKVGDIASPSMTAEGLLCRQYLGWDRNVPGMVQGLGALANNHPIDYREPDVYYWYYATQSLHHFGGPMWTKWNDTLKVALPDRQERRGGERGSWSPANDAWGRHAGRLYTTCFSLYCLEVYYRHMPLYATDDA